MITPALFPIIRIADTLVLSIPPALSDDLVIRMRDELCLTIAAAPAAGLIVDASGVDIMDSYMTRCIRDLAVAVRLMGVPTVVAGLRPAVVLTLIEMGMDLPGVTTALTVERAMEALQGDRPELASDPMSLVANADETLAADAGRAPVPSSPR